MLLVLVPEALVLRGRSAHPEVPVLWAVVGVVLERGVVMAAGEDASRVVEVPRFLVVAVGELLFFPAGRVVQRGDGEALAHVWHCVFSDLVLFLEGVAFTVGECGPLGVVFVS